MTTKSRILYFIEGSQPSDEDKAAAEALGPVMYRNARFIDESAEAEPCDAVAGRVPANYKIFPAAAPVGTEQEKPVETPTPAPVIEAAVAAENQLAAASGDEDMMKEPEPAAQQPWSIAAAPIGAE